MGVQAGAGGGAAERNLRDLGQRVAHAPRAEAHLGGVAAELLTQRDRHGIHQVRPARFDDVLELLGLVVKRLLETLQGGQQMPGGLVERGQVDR